MLSAFNALSLHYNPCDNVCLLEQIDFLFKSLLKYHFQLIRDSANTSFSSQIWHFRWLNVTRKRTGHADRVYSKFKIADVTVTANSYGISNLKDMHLKKKYKEAYKGKYVLSWIQIQWKRLLKSDLKFFNIGYRKNGLTQKLRMMRDIDLVIASRIFKCFFFLNDLYAVRHDNVIEHK